MLSSKINENWNNAREEILLYLAMANLTKNKPAGVYHDEVASNILETYHVLMGETVFTNPCDKLKTSELVVNLG